MISFYIKSSLSLLLLFGLYWFLLRKEKLLVFNRFFLILSVVCSMVLPFVSIPVNTTANQPLERIGTALNSLIPGSEQFQNPVNSGLNISNNETVSPGINLPIILIIIYSVGLVLFLARFLINISSIYRQMRVSENATYNGYKLVLCDNSINPFCFFNSIFVSREDYFNKTVDEDLLDHEAGHIKQFHSIDILFIELIQIFYWFNPIIILYNRAIRVNHEFLADDCVIQNSDNIKTYSDKLLNFIDYKSRTALTSGFYHSQTKKRLIMMTKTKSGTLSGGFRITTILVLMFILVVSVSWKSSNSRITAFLSGKTVDNVNDSGTRNFLYLNPTQLKSLGIELNKHGLFYKNLNPNWKQDRARYSGLGFVCDKKNYVSSSHFDETDKLNEFSRFFRQKQLTKNDFYPLLIGNTKNEMSLDNEGLPQDMLFLPVAVCMAEAVMSGRNDTIVVWFKPTESLKKALPENINPDDYLRMRSKENK